MAMNIYIFGNGNTSFADFKAHDEAVIHLHLQTEGVSFSVCDFRGIDTLTMELLKCAPLILIRTQNAKAERKKILNAAEVCVK